eukprot:TRINITY_DN46089_c0_g1_i1.p1 TRINITY_DN46089_c0_g1~~TRINITY_DN46089_c0_g1_i1.p1  ORF type:complete len:100 (-),score=1.93 TRINITY_DN46089_c0_g1_i1:95-394(-)
MKASEPIEYCLLASRIRDTVKLRAVAGREHRRFTDLWQVTQFSQCGFKLRWRKSHLLTHGHAGGTMIYSQGKKRHALCVFASVSDFLAAVVMISGCTVN